MPDLSLNSLERSATKTNLSETLSFILSLVQRAFSLVCFVREEQKGRDHSQRARYLHRREATKGRAGARSCGYGGNRTTS